MFEWVVLCHGGIVAGVISQVGGWDRRTPSPEEAIKWDRTLFCRSLNDYYDFESGLVDDVLFAGLGTGMIQRGMSEINDSVMLHTASVFSTLISIGWEFVTLTVIDSGPDSGSGSSSIFVECPEIRENLPSLAVSLKSVAMKVMDFFLNYRSIVCFRNHRFRAHSLIKDQLLTAPCLEDLDAGPSHAVSPSVMTVESEE